MDKVTWLERCAARYKACVPDLSDEHVKYLAEIALDSDTDGDFADDPEGMADADLECWD